MTIYSVMKDLYENEKDDWNISDCSLKKYSKFFPEDIVRYFFFKHRSQYSLFSEFDGCALGKKPVTITYLSTKEVLDIKYGNFCKLRDDSKEAFEGLECMSPGFFSRNFGTGSWNAPIVLVRKENGLYTADGNNRLRLLRCCINSNMPISEKHKVYILN